MSGGSLGPAVDPFGPVANPALYVPRPACEVALDGLQAALRGGALVVALSGPVGAGKRIVLRVLEQRLRSAFQPVALASGPASASELAEQVLRALSDEGPGDPERLLLAAALRHKAEGRPLVLILEQASTLSEETARALAVLLRDGEGALRCVVRLDDDRGREAALTLAPEVAEISLRAPMSEAESIRFVRQRLEAARASDPVRLRFHDELILRLHRATGGVPGALNALAARVAAGESPVAAAPEPPAASPAWRADPFGPSAATGAYQPRPATEAILVRLEDLLAAGRQTLVLHGPEGLGKTTVLRVLRQRLSAPFQAVELPYGRFDPDDFWSYVLFQLGAPRGEVPERDVLEAIQYLGRGGRVLVLLVDEAEALPDATRARLAAVLQQAGATLRVVLTVGAGVDRSAFAELPDAEWLALTERLSEPEALAYVAGRLERFDAPPDVRARFDGATLATLFRASRGVPRELNRLAGEIERDPSGEGPATRLAQPSPPPIDAPVKREAAAPPEREVSPEPIAPAEREAPPEPIAPAEREAPPVSVAPAEREAPPASVAPPETESIPGPPSPAPDTPPPLEDAATRPAERPAAELQRIAEVRAAEGARRRLSAPPALPARPVRTDPDVQPTAPARRPEAARDLADVLPHLALGAGVPLTLLLLWLWLAPVFAPAPGPPAAPPAEQIRVHINATPWARVQVDGRPLGVTPLGNVPLSPGAHEFRAELPDGRVLERRVDVSESRRHIAFP